MSQYSVNLNDNQEVLTAFIVIKTIIRNNPELYAKFKNQQKSNYDDQGQAYSGSQDLMEKNMELKGKVQSLESLIKEEEDTIKELKETIKVAKRNADKEASSHAQDLKIRDDTIEKQHKDIEELRLRLDEAKSEIKEANDFIESEEADHKREVKELNDKYHQQERESRERYKELENRYETIKGRLLVFEPEFGAKVGEEMKYQVDENASIPTLTQTIFDDAPYIVQKNESGSVTFQFNYEKGKSQTAIANRAKWLEPFCEIVEEVSEANTIRPAGIGIAELNASGEINVITKRAKIKLVKI